MVFKSELRKRIEDLKERVERLENDYFSNVEPEPCFNGLEFEDIVFGEEKKIPDLRELGERIERIESDIFSQEGLAVIGGPFGGTHPPHNETPTKILIELLLDHLGLEVKKHDTPKIELVKKEKKCCKEGKK